MLLEQKCGSSKAFGANNIAEAKKHWLNIVKKKIVIVVVLTRSRQHAKPAAKCYTGAEIPQNLRESMSRYVDTKIKDLDGKFNKYVCIEKAPSPTPPMLGR